MNYATETATVDAYVDEMNDTTMRPVPVTEFLTGRDPYDFDFTTWQGPKAKLELDAKAKTVSASPVDSAHAWYVSGLRRIESLRELPVGWHECDANAPNEVATTLATLVLRSLSDISFKPSRIDPSSDEGICISFEKSDRYADIECYNSGELVLLKMYRGGVPEARTISRAELGDAILDVNAYIA